MIGESFARLRSNCNLEHFGKIVPIATINPLRPARSAEPRQRASRRRSKKEEHQT